MSERAIGLLPLLQECVHLKNHSLLHTLDKYIHQNNIRCNCVEIVILAIDIVLL